LAGGRGVRTTERSKKHLVGLVLFVLLLLLLFLGLGLVLGLLLLVSLPLGRFVLRLATAQPAVQTGCRPRVFTGSELAQTNGLLLGFVPLKLFLGLTVCVGCR